MFIAIRDPLFLPTHDFCCLYIDVCSQNFHEMDSSLSQRVKESTTVFKSAKYVEQELGRLSGKPLFKRRKTKKNWLKHYISVSRIPGENYLSICHNIMPTLVRHWSIVFGDNHVHIKWVALTEALSGVVFTHLKQAISHDIVLECMTGSYHFYHMFTGYAQHVYYISE